MDTKPKLALAIALGVLLVFSSFFVGYQQSKPDANVDRDVLFQLAAFNTFSSGDYSGTMTYADLAKHGDFGIGTLDGLDGEMIALNGVFYHIPSEGKPVQISPEAKAPYATVTFFEADQTLTVDDLNYTQLKAQLDDALPKQNAIYAIKVTGTFEWALTRSPQKQVEPYPVLTDALKSQSIFTLNNFSASVAGFWFPSSMDGVDYTGYHLHMIADSKEAGGHLLDCTIKNATVEIDAIKRYELILP